MTLTASAIKTANSGKVYYYPNGGTAKSDHPLLTSGDYSGASSTTNSFTYEDTSKDLYDPTSLFTRTGYHYESTAKAWRLGSSTSTTYLDCSSQDMSSHVKDKTGVALKAYANWIANTYSVKYNANGGSGTMANSSHTYNTAKALTNNAFTRTGYDFAGWATSDTGAVVYQNGASVKNLTATNGDTVNLYAVWKVHTGKIYYHPNNGTALDQYPLQTEGTYAGFSSTVHDVNYNSTNFNIWDVDTLFSRKGYHIPSAAQAWRYNSPTSSTYFNQTSFNFSTYLASSTNVVFRLYANWLANTYTIKYNPNGGSGSMPDTGCTYDESTTLTSNAITKPGYNFMGWATEADGEVVYEDGASVINLTTVNGGTVNLYAVWKLVDLIQIGLNGKWNKVLTYIGKDGEWQRVKIRSGVDGKWT
jgi:uncharacterized repeat protein (TIGR02543 family)